MGSIQHVTPGVTPPEIDQVEEAAVARQFAQAVQSGRWAEGVDLALKFELSAAEARVICGPGLVSQADRVRVCGEWVQAFLAPRAEEMRQQLAQKTRLLSICRVCGGDLIGTELQHSTCGQCGGRALSGAGR